HDDGGNINGEEALNLFLKRIRRCSRLRFGSDDIITWVGLMVEAMLGSNDGGEAWFRDALNVFDEMLVRDSVTWNSMLKGCFDCGNFDVGFELLDAMPERHVVFWTMVINGFLRYRRVEDAKRLFSQMPVKDEIT
ncbi:pentatricopeptide repeat-containing protein, partial [Tanacetum coccineum]